MSIADVEAEDVLSGLSSTAAVLDVEHVVGRQVVHGERHVGGDHVRAAGRASWRKSSSQVLIRLAGRVRVSTGLGFGRDLGRNV